MLNKKDLSLDGECAECAVCHQPIPKDRVHYGGVTCYSCRAFFRRNTQRDELPQCKSDGGCRITYIDRKQCSACRYSKCIRIGMKPELVLTEEDKKRRFKKFLNKKSADCVDSGSGLMEQELDLPALEPIQSSVCSFLTPSFRQNLHLLFNRQNSGLHPTYLEEKRNFNNNYNKEASLTPLPPPQFNFLNSLHCAAVADEREDSSAPIDYSNSIKDMEALKYFATRGQLSTLVSPNIGQKYLVSPNNAELFVKPVSCEEAQDYSVPRTERKSVITFPQLRVKSEAAHGYLHKKFRSQQESHEMEEEGEEGEEEFGKYCQTSQQRQSVILHSSSANKT